jgi:thiol-disulfide isomerase/thioredoxin
MRLIIVCVAFGLPSITSCSETQRQPGMSEVEDHPMRLTQTDAHEQSSVHSHGDIHAGHGREQPVTSDAVNHKVVHSSPHGDGHVGASEHARERHADDQDERRSRSHAHQNGRHGHSELDHATYNTKKIAIGDKVPDFEVTINGKKLKLSELQKNAAMTENGTLMLTFWCSFCHSCRHVERRLDELSRQYRGKVGIIALDASAGETTEDVAEFAKERALTLPIALDATGTTADIFGARVTTTTVIIDNAGVLRYRGQFGDHKHAFAQDALRAVLAGEELSVQETRQKG